MSNFKDEFKLKMQDLLKDEYDQFLNSLDNPPIKGITVNFDRLGDNDLSDITNLKLAPIPEISNGFFVKDEIKIGKAPLHHLGILYSQEPSAMYPVEMLNVNENDIILDLCASPGGKSIQILEKLNNTGMLVSNEIVYNRAKILYENLNRMGFNNFAITCNSPADFEKCKIKFDKILVDAPCGGEGMFRKKDFDFNAYNNASIETNAKRQLSILESVKNLLRQGGKLVYSTCTYDIRENELVVVEFLKNNPDFEIIAYPRLDLVTTSGVEIEGFQTHLTRRRYPHLFPGEGQFMALLQRKTNENSESEELKTDKFFANGFSEIFKKDIEVMQRDISQYADIKGLNIAKKNDSLFILPSTLLNFQNLNVLSIGTLLGNIIKSSFKPAHTSFHSFPQIYFNSINLDDNQIEDYLKGLEIDVEDNLKGVVVVKYKNIPLGGGKISNGKLKNYYPKDLRN